MRILLESTAVQRVWVFQQALIRGKILSSPFQSNELIDYLDIQGQNVEYTLELVEDTCDLGKKLSLGGGVSLSAAGLLTQGSAAANLLKTFQYNACNVYFLASVTVTKSQEMLKEVTLSEAASSLISEGSIDRFRAIYGDGYIAGIIRGGYYYGLVEVRCDSLHEKKELINQLKCLSFIAVGSLSGVFSNGNILTSDIVRSRSRFTVVRSGGLLESAATNIEEMLNELSDFPDRVAKRPAVPYVLYQSYDDICPFSEIRHTQIEENRRIARYVEQLQEIYLRCKDDCSAIKGLLSSYPSSLSAVVKSEDLDTTRLSLQEDISGIEAQMKSLSEHLMKCHETTETMVDLESLYELSPVTQKVLDAYATNTEELSPIKMSADSRKQPTGARGTNSKKQDKRLIYNAAVIGFTGVGKSSLVNYLFGQEVAETGVGRPVTSRGFYSFNFMIGNLPVCIYDSWGLEVDKSDEWLQSLSEELSKRGTDRPAEDWFHTVLYCVNGASSRIQDAELNIINKLIHSRYTVVILITKADTITEEDEVLLCKTIKNNVCGEVQVIPVCTQSRITRGGSNTIPFGKEKVIEQIFDNFWRSITSRLPERCIKLLEKYIDKWRIEQIANISELNLKGESIEEIKKSVIDSLNEKHLNRLVRNEIKRTMGIYGKIMSGIESIDCIDADFGFVDRSAKINEQDKPSTDGFLFNAGLIGFYTGPVVALVGFATGAFLWPVGLAIAGASLWLVGSEENRKHSRSRENTINNLIQCVESDARILLDTLPEREEKIRMMLDAMGKKSLKSRK